MLNILRGFVSGPEPTNQSLAIQGHAHVQLQIQNEHNISNTSAVIKLYRMTTILSCILYRKGKTSLELLSIKEKNLDYEQSNLLLIIRVGAKPEQKWPST